MLNGLKKLVWQLTGAQALIDELSEAHRGAMLSERAAATEADNLRDKLASTSKALAAAEARAAQLQNFADAGGEADFWRQKAGMLAHQLNQPSDDLRETDLATKFILADNDQTSVQKFRAIKGHFQTYQWGVGKLVERLRRMKHPEVDRVVDDIEATMRRRL